VEAAAGIRARVSAPAQQGAGRSTRRDHASLVAIQHSGAQCPDTTRAWIRPCTQSITDQVTVPLVFEISEPPVADRFAQACRHFITKGKNDNGSQNNSLPGLWQIRLG
jgi:hypothetical protein